MEARELIDEAATFFAPNALSVIGQAFEEAWAGIAANFGTDPTAVDAARMTLAIIVLSIANDGSRDTEELREEALRIMERECGVVPPAD